MTTPFWLQEPTILFHKDKITELWPQPEMGVNEKLNAISRLVILLTLLGFLMSQNIQILITGAVTLAVLIALYHIKKENKEKNMKRDLVLDKIKKEGFTNPEQYKQLKGSLTPPTIKNPMMNVLLPEIKYNPTRKEAAPAFNSEVEKEINDATQDMVVKTFNNPTDIKQKLFRDLGNSFNFDTSMRNFYSTPNTQIPNDQQAFAEYCYGDMISCKEGNALACTRDNPRWTNY